MASPQRLVAAAADKDQVSGTTPGTLANMFELLCKQFGDLAVVPDQAMTQQDIRHARRVYVGGLPPTANEQFLSTFLSYVLSEIGGSSAGPGDAVVNVYINHEKKFALLEMRSVEEASNAMALDGIFFEGTPLNVRRPRDYNPSLAASLGPSQPNPNLNLVAVGLTPDSIFLAGLPGHLNEERIIKLLEKFGRLCNFHFVKDRETGNSRGYAFCAYEDPSVAYLACAALNGITRDDGTLIAKRADRAQKEIAEMRMVQPESLASKILCLTHVVIGDELIDDVDYIDIYEDMKTDSGEFDGLVKTVIPSPNPNGDPSPGLGKVFLEYVDLESASKARVALNRRKIGGIQVVAAFYHPENKFLQQEFDG